MRKVCHAISTLSGVVALLVIPPLFAAEIEKTTVMVPMPDGTRLATDVYLPADWQEPMPVLLKRTPYNKNTDGIEFARVTQRHVSRRHPSRIILPQHREQSSRVSREAELNRARVMQDKTNATTVALYNEVNGASVTALNQTIKSSPAHILVAPSSGP